MGIFFSYVDLNKRKSNCPKISSCMIVKVALVGMFCSVVAVAFQITFYAEMHANDVFLFLKNYF